ncbi:hypothetical protein [Nitrospira sp. BLG_2]|uniref:hypothetical protein n=1 Tax=Nitrospira sp. BLG_2 TaxID=3397507 RepID=UPI003B98FEEA
MKQPIRTLFVLLVFMCYGSLSACSWMDRFASPPLEPIPMTDIKATAGTWEGIMVRSPATRSDDWVTLRIREDGMYHFESIRTIGVFSGSGQFTLEDGKLFARSSRGTITAQLHRHVGQDDHILKAEGTTSDGITYRAQLTPKRP